MAKSPTHFRFWIFDFRLSDQAIRIASEYLCHVFVPGSKSKSKIQNYLMTRSARASTFGGIVRPICFAVLRLITNSNFVGCSTGSSPGLAPFNTLSTYQAPRWPMLYLSGS